MKFTKIFGKAHKELIMEDTSCFPPAEWDVATEHRSLSGPKYGYSAQDRNITRKCPICLTAYRPDQMDHDSNTHLDSSMDNPQAFLVHRRHSATSSVSSDSRLANSDITASPDAPLFSRSRRNSRFLEDLGTANQDFFLSLQSTAQQNDFLCVSGHSAQRRRRRSAISCGSDNDELNNRISSPNLVSRPPQEALEASTAFYHLNGVRMKF